MITRIEIAIAKSSLIRVFFSQAKKREKFFVGPRTIASIKQIDYRQRVIKGIAIEYAFSIELKIHILE